MQSPSAPQQGVAGAAASAAADEETEGAPIKPTGVYLESVVAAAFPETSSESVAAEAAQAGNADTRTDTATGGPTDGQAITKIGRASCRERV